MPTFKSCSTFFRRRVKIGRVSSPDSKPEATPDIQEILRERREMLNRVKADLERVGKLQQEFRDAEEKAARGPAPTEK